MILTPHVIRTHEITEDDLKPLFIGSAGNLGIGGPPPLIAQPPAPEPPPAPAAPAAPNSSSGVPSVLPGPGGVLLGPPPGSSPVPGTGRPAPATPPTSTPLPDLPTPPPAPAPTAPPPPAPAPTPAPDTVAPRVPPQSAESGAPITSPGVGSAQVIISPPATTFRVAGGPYIVPLSIVDAARVSTMTLTLMYDPTKLRVRAVQEGSFMRAGGVGVTFSQQLSGDRIDITLARAADSTGASGTGLLSAVLFDAVSPGNVTLTLSGSATGPGGQPMGLQFRPITITVQ